MLYHCYYSYCQVWCQCSYLHSEI